MPEIHVAVGYCTPIRDQVLTALKPYGVVVHKLDAWGEGRYEALEGGGINYSKMNTGKVSDDDQFAASHHAKVEVSQEAVEWVEYLLLRTKKFTLMSKPYNPNNKVWAAKWDTMPLGWTQEGCSGQHGVAQDDAIEQVVQHAKRGSRQSRSAKTRTSKTNIRTSAAHQRRDARRSERRSR